MANIGKRILSAFVEVTEDEPSVVKQQLDNTVPSTNVARAAVGGSGTAKFRQYFDQLFKEANLPGPDYFEFSKMTEAMQGITDEKARYGAAFAGLSVQGLDKQKLLYTATQYLQVLETDATNFTKTVDAALKEKVQGKQQEIENNSKRIEALSKEISELQNKMALLQEEVKENEEKIESNSGAYMQEMQLMKSKMLQDVEKIKMYVS
jgi:uncharacterized protein YoxC